VDAADREGMRVRPAAGGLLHACAPLTGTVEVANTLAGVDQVTADRLHQLGIGDLSGDRGRDGLVEAAEALVDLALGDGGEPVETEREQLRVAGSHATGDLNRLRGLHAWLEVVQQPVSALEASRS
jgi:hypothetical protein